MLTFTAPGDVRSWSTAQRCSHRSIGLVPTMGSLHDGHLALISDMRGRCDVVVVSIFVNPLQFNRSNDFASYPRPLDRDLAVCDDAGVDAVYAPTPATMYPKRFGTGVAVAELDDGMEGAMRPGHFGGVTTVVTKLFNAIRPDVAIFGEKDFQQLAIIRRMTLDLDVGIEIVGHPIVREADGVALSSRNTLLGSDERAAARCVPRSLDAAVAQAAATAATVEQVVAAAASVTAAEPLARPEYVTVFDADTLAELEVLTPSARIATAVWLGEVRLIDNQALFDD